MSKKIFRSIIAVAMVVLLASLFIASSFLYDYFNKSQVTQLKEELSLVATNVDKVGTEYFDNFDSSVFRFTLVSADGSVLYDSQAKAEDMENHLEREEIAEALENGNGSSARYSSTLTERTFYEATRLQNGNVLRISVSQVTVGALILGMLPAIVAIILISAVVALVLSHKMAKDIVKPLNQLDLENPAENETYEDDFDYEEEINNEEPPITQPGDIWQLGRHRLLCGDSTDKDCIDRLMNGKKADLVFTDPPYGMKKEKDGVANDNLNYDDLLEFNKRWIPLTFEALKENGSWYCWGIDEPLMDIYSHILKPMMKQNKITFRNLITWDKGTNGNGINTEGGRMFAANDEKCLFVMCGVQGFSQ